MGSFGGKHLSSAGSLAWAVCRSCEYNVARPQSALVNATGVGAVSGDKWNFSRESPQPVLPCGAMHGEDSGGDSAVQPTGGEQLEPEQQSLCALQAEHLLCQLAGIRLLHAGLSGEYC